MMRSSLVGAVVAALCGTIFACGCNTTTLPVTIAVVRASVVDDATSRNVCPNVVVTCVGDGGWITRDDGWTIGEGGWTIREGEWALEDGGWTYSGGGWTVQDDKEYTLDDGGISSMRGGWTIGEGKWSLPDVSRSRYVGERFGSAGLLGATVDIETSGTCDAGSKRSVWVAGLPQDCGDVSMLVSAPGYRDRRVDAGVLQCGAGGFDVVIRMTPLP